MNEQQKKNRVNPISLRNTTFLGFHPPKISQNKMISVSLNNPLREYRFSTKHQNTPENLVGSIAHSDHWKISDCRILEIY